MANNYKLEVVKHGTMYLQDDGLEAIVCPECGKIATFIDKVALRDELKSNDTLIHPLKVHCHQCQCQFKIVPDKPN